MNLLEDLLERARSAPRRVVLCEGQDPRIIEGALRAQRDGIADPIILGERKPVMELIARSGGKPADLEIVDPKTDPRAGSYAEIYRTLRPRRKIELAAAREAIADPLNFGAMMVRQGDADGSLSGSLSPTADTVWAALQAIGRAPGIKTLSSCFLMVQEQPHHLRKEVVVFADCGLIVEPTEDQLADIAVTSADTYETLIGGEPKVAMLSFSTDGSARHSRVTRVRNATRKAQVLRPDRIIHGEVQFDAAVVPEVSALKAKDSPLKGKANVLIFPSLEAANIAYKVAERVGGATALGPILQGLAKPANDLSRGCSAEDVYYMIAVTVVQSHSSPSSSGSL